MSIEILLACMNQEDSSIIKKINIQTNALIVNQCGRNSYQEEEYNINKTVKMLSSNQKGLSRSRNLALANASGHICAFCDDDVEYVENYAEIITDAFNQLPDADIIIFNIERINYDRNVKPIQKIRKAPKYKAYGSVRIAFKLKSIQSENIWFNVNFGAGSIYSSGEESLLLRESHKKNLNIYEYPAIIAKVDFSESSWREGYNEKFFYDKGAFLAAGYPLLKYIFSFYYLKILKKHTELSSLEIIKWTISGIKGYKKLMSYEEYKKYKC